MSVRSDSKSDYIGRIGNTGAQYVQAPVPTAPKGAPGVKPGGDLRARGPRAERKPKK